MEISSKILRLENECKHITQLLHIYTHYSYTLHLAFTELQKYDKTSAACLFLVSEKCRSYMPTHALVLLKQYSQTLAGVGNQLHHHVDVVHLRPSCCSCCLTQRRRDERACQHRNSAIWF